MFYSAASCAPPLATPLADASTRARHSPPFRAAAQGFAAKCRTRPRHAPQTSGAAASCRALPYFFLGKTPTDRPFPLFFFLPRMSYYLETFLVAHRRLVRESEHRLRLARTLRCAPDSPAVSRLLALAAHEALGAPDVPRLRGRLVYNLHGEADFSLLPYAPRRIETLRLVHDDHIDYSLKRTDRSALDACFARRRGADDVIIVRRGLLTDTTVANLALFDPYTARWYTPAVPLLAGTHRSALLSAGVLTPHPNLTPESLVRFPRLRLFNALLGWGECELPITAIKY